MRYTNKFVQFLGGNNTIVIASQKDFKFINDLVKKVGLDLPWKSYTELLKLAVINKCLVDKSKVIIEYQQFKGFTFGYKSYEESENWYGQTPFFVEDIKEEFEKINKTNLHVNVFENHDHDLNFLIWLLKGTMPAGIKCIFDTVNAI